MDGFDYSINEDDIPENDIDLLVACIALVVLKLTNSNYESEREQFSILSISHELQIPCSIVNR